MQFNVTEYRRVTAEDEINLDEFYEKLNYGEELENNLWLY